MVIESALADLSQQQRSEMAHFGGKICFLYSSDHLLGKYRCLEHSFPSSRVHSVDWNTVKQVERTEKWSGRLKLVNIYVSYFVFG